MLLILVALSIVITLPAIAFTLNGRAINIERGIQKRSHKPKNKSDNFQIAILVKLNNLEEY